MDRKQPPLERTLSPPPPAPLFLLALRVYIKLQEKCLSYGRYVYLLNRLFVTCSMMTWSKYEIWWHILVPVKQTFCISYVCTEELISRSQTIDSEVRKVFNVDFIQEFTVERANPSWTVVILVRKAGSPRDDPGSFFPTDSLSLFWIVTVYLSLPSWAVPLDYQVS